MSRWYAPSIYIRFALPPTSRLKQDDNQQGPFTGRGEKPPTTVKAHTYLECCYNLGSRDFIKFDLHQ